jgi:hypothetical protein
MENPAYRPDNPFPAMKQDLGSQKSMMMRWEQS